MMHEPLNRARELSGLVEKTSLVHAGLEALIAREAGKYLAALYGASLDCDQFRAVVLMLNCEV